MHSPSKPFKIKRNFIYLLIIGFFLLLAWIVWQFYESKIEKAEAEKNKNDYGMQIMSAGQFDFTEDGL